MNREKLIIPALLIAGVLTVLIIETRTETRITNQATSSPITSVAPSSSGSIALFEDADSVVTRWNKIFLSTIATEQTNPPEASRYLAMVHETLHNGAAAHPEWDDETLEDYVALMSAEALIMIYPVMQNLAEQSIAALSADESLHAQARQDALAMMVNRETDGASFSKDYPIRDDIGYWNATPPYYLDPLLPHWGDVQLFAATQDDIQLPAPPSVDTDLYATEFEEVKQLGSIESTMRTDDQSEIAQYWADGKGTHTPPGHWNVIAGDVLNDKKLALREQLEVYATLNIALADAGIGAWKNKFDYEYWRPIDAIRRAADDNNPSTAQDSNWTNFIETPNFPEYPSGHSAFSGAGATVLAHYFGDDTPFTSMTLGIVGVNRSYGSFSQAADEAGMSRIYGGIHFQSANTQGLALGKAVAKKAIQHTSD